MKEIIESVLQVEKESEARLAEARKQAGDIKKECDRELAEQTRILKEELTAAYQKGIGMARRKLEESYRNKVESEKEIHNTPVNLEDEPYNTIVERVVDIIAVAPVMQRE